MKTIKKICNKCECAISPNDEEKIQVSFEHSFGYGSPYDGQHWKIDLCKQCNNSYKDYDETSPEDLIKTFKLVPSGFMIDSHLQLDEERHQKVFDSWKVTGEWEELRHHTYDELVDFKGYFTSEDLNEYILKYHIGMPLLVDEILGPEVSGYRDGM